MPLPPLLIFDMDGVLVDVRSSYRQVVIQTVQFYLGDCLGLALPPGLVTPALVETCKLMGGFNNDWDLTAGLIGYFLTHLPSAPEPAAPVADLDAILACLAQTPMPADAASRLQAAADRLDSLTGAVRQAGGGLPGLRQVCLLNTSYAADERSWVELGGPRTHQKQQHISADAARQPAHA